MPDLMPNDSIQGMKLWEKSDTACRITKQRHGIWVKITNNMSEPLYKACDTCKKSPNHVRSLCTRHENREKSLAACYSQVNLYVFNIPSLQLIQFQPSLLFSESEPEAIIPATPQVLDIDGFWGKRYNAESDGARKSTVPIILTVGEV